MKLSDFADRVKSRKIAAGIAWDDTDEAWEVMVHADCQHVIMVCHPDLEYALGAAIRAWDLSHPQPD